MRVHFKKSTKHADQMSIVEMRPQCFSQEAAIRAITGSDLMEINLLKHHKSSADAAARAVSLRVLLKVKRPPQTFPGGIVFGQLLVNVAFGIGGIVLLISGSISPT
jgi:hypothetical protein